MIKKFRLFLPSDVEKEEQWLTEMSAQGYHFFKLRLGTYYFEEDSNHSYVYQIDFNNYDEEYAQLYKDAGWEQVESFLNSFHYFRSEANQTGVQKIYSDKESTKDTYLRIMKFYLIFFIFLIIAMISNILTWKGEPIQFIAISIVAITLVLYIYIFFALKRKISFYQS